MPGKRHVRLKIPCLLLLPYRILPCRILYVCSVNPIQCTDGNVSMHRKCSGQSQPCVHSVMPTSWPFECPCRNDGIYDWSVPLRKLKNDPLTTQRIQELLKTLYCSTSEDDVKWCNDAWCRGLDGSSSPALIQGMSIMSPHVQLTGAMKLSL